MDDVFGSIFDVDVNDVDLVNEFDDIDVEEVGEGDELKGVDD